MSWNLEQWRLAQAVDAGRVRRGADGCDWLDHGKTAPGTFQSVRVTRPLAAFIADGLVILSSTSDYWWTESGLARFRAERDRRIANVRVAPVVRMA